MRWHRDSLFTAGPRRPLSRDERRVWLARADLARRRGLVTALHVEVGRALLRRLGVDGRLDPSHETIATDAGCSSRTVQRALRRLADAGLLTWQRRLVRAGWRCEQASNAYALVPDGAPIPAPVARPRCDGQPARATHVHIPLGDRTAALAALARAREGALARLSRRATPALGSG